MIRQTDQMRVLLDDGRLTGVDAIEAHIFIEFVTVTQAMIGHLCLPRPRVVEWIVDRDHSR